MSDDRFSTSQDGAVTIDAGKTGEVVNMASIHDAEAAIRKRLVEIRNAGGGMLPWEALHLEQAMQCLGPNASARPAFIALEKSKLESSERSWEDRVEFETVYARHTPKGISELEALLMEKSSALV